MSVLLVIAVGIGGALGALTRAWCTDVLSPRLPQGLPYPTLLINITACFLIGIIAHVCLEQPVQLMICMGFLGGFSTLATVCREAVAYWTGGRRWRCAGYLALTFATCLAATAAGFCLVAAW